MMSQRELFFWIICLGLCPTILAADENPDAATEQIDRLVRQLDDDSFRVRQRASRELTRIGEPALSALRVASRSPSLERRYRALKLIRLIQHFDLYTISRDGRLFRIIVRRDRMQKELIVRLAKPFGEPSARAEGLAIGPDGLLYASLVMTKNSKPKSRLFRIMPENGAIKSVGTVVAAEVDGLDFGPGRKLFGAISSNSRAQNLGLEQIISIDTNSAEATTTPMKLCFGDLDALAFSTEGHAFVTNGARGLYSVDPWKCNTLSDEFTDRPFQRFLRGYDQMEGLCITADGAAFGLCNEDRTFLVRLDLHRGGVTKIGDLGFAALCLAADKFRNDPKIERDRAKHRRIDRLNRELDQTVILNSQAEQSLQVEP